MSELFGNGGFGIHVSLDMFLDRARILAVMDDKSNRACYETGLFGRKVMQRGMHKTKNAISSEGEYPRAHGNPLLRDKIRFGYDATIRELIIGPALLDKTDKDVAAAGMTVPELINSGGTVMRRKVYDAKRKQIRPLRASEQPRAWHYKKRPFVRLTLPLVAAKLKEKMQTLELKGA
jgi:hypothetical protein